jgi:hypothetical protein
VENTPTRRKMMYGPVDETQFRHSVEKHVKLITQCDIDYDNNNCAITNPPNVEEVIIEE